jgi:hypothetical protein
MNTFTKLIIIMAIATGSFMPGKWIFAGEIKNNPKDDLQRITEDSTDNQRNRVRMIRELFGNIDLSLAENGTIETIVGDRLGFGIIRSNPEERVFNFLDQYHELFGINNPRIEFSPTFYRDSLSSYDRLWCGLSVNGIKVLRWADYEPFELGYLVFIKTDSSRIFKLDGLYCPDARNVNTTPEISADQAKVIAISNSAGRDSVQGASTPELFVGCNDTNCYLIWRLGVTGSRSVIYLIDAHTGAILYAREGYRY